MAPAGGFPPGLSADMMNDHADFEMEENDWKIQHMEKSDVGETVDIFPKRHGEGAVTKKLLKEGVEYENPREGWAVELSYEARVVGGDGTPFESVDKKIIALVQGAFPVGVEAGIKTMRETERALITIQAAKAFGEAGDPSKGVPPNSAVEYEMTLHRIIEISRYDEGRIVRRRMVRVPPRPASRGPRLFFSHAYFFSHGG